VYELQNLGVVVVEECLEEESEFSETIFVFSSFLSVRKSEDKTREKEALPPCV